MYIGRLVKRSVVEKRWLDGCGLLKTGMVAFPCEVSV